VCKQIAQKQRRIGKMKADIERWQREGNRPATLERTENDKNELHRSISSLWKLESTPRGTAWAVLERREKAVT